MQYGAHVSHMGQMLNECMVSGPIFRDIRKSIARCLVCWNKFNKRTWTKERRATLQTRTRYPKSPQFQHVSLMGLSEAQCSSIVQKPQNRGYPLAHVQFIISCMERQGLSITKGINTVSTAIYSTLLENQPPLKLQLCFLNVFEDRIFLPSGPDYQL